MYTDSDASSKQIRPDGAPTITPTNTQHPSAPNSSILPTSALQSACRLGLPAPYGGMLVQHGTVRRPIQYCTGRLPCTPCREPGSLSTQSDCANHSPLVHKVQTWQPHCLTPAWVRPCLHTRPHLRLPSCPSATLSLQPVCCPCVFHHKHLHHAAPAPLILRTTTAVTLCSHRQGARHCLPVRASACPYSSCAPGCKP